MANSNTHNVGTNMRNFILTLKQIINRYFAIVVATIGSKLAFQTFLRSDYK